MAMVVPTKNNQNIPAKTVGGGEEPAARRLEAALRGLIKLLNAIRFYPPGHPSLQETTRDSLQAVLPLFQGQVEFFAFTVRKDHFALGEEKIGADNAPLAKLATYLFIRRVQQLMFLPGLSVRELWSFAQMLTLDPAETHKRGGVPKLLVQLRIAAIAANELDLAKVLARNEEMEELPPEEENDILAGDITALLDPAAEGDAAPVASSMEQLEQLLGQLRQPRSDVEFRKLVLQVPPLIQPNLTEGGRFLVLQALAALAGWAGDQTLPPDRSAAADTALSQLTGEHILDFIIVSLCAKGLADDQREQIYTLLPTFGRAMTERLLGRLASEEESGARRFLSDALVRQGSLALPILIESLKDSRWYVVRNCVAILGEIRDPAAIPSLKTTLGHDEPRVRKETIRSLTRIGGPQAVEVLQRTLTENDLDLRRQAVISLGAIRHAAAVPALLKIVTASDPMVKQLDMKKLAIKALAEIGSSEAVSPLARIVVKRRMFFRARHDELRAVATAALGEIGHPAASEILEWATEDRAPAVARAAVLAVKQLAKGASK